MNVDSVYLIKFNIETNTNEHINYQLLAEDGIIIEKSGTIGVGYFHDTHDGSTAKLNKLIERKKEKGYKVLMLEEMKEHFEQYNYHYLTDKSSGILIFDREAVESFIKHITDNTSYDIEVSAFTNNIPVTNKYQTPLGLVQKSVIYKAFNILGKIEEALANYKISNYTKMDLKRFLKIIRRRKDKTLTFCDDDDIKNIRSSAETLCGYLNEYFCLIPTELQAEEILDMLLTSETLISNQKEICNLMLKYYTEVETFNNVALLNITDNDIKIEKVIDNDKITEISSLYTLNDRYYPKTRIKNVFKIHFGAHFNRFNLKSRSIGNIQTMWHGTKKKNIASILTKGLLLPLNLNGSERYGTYGHGIYFSSASSKSLKFCNNWLTSKKTSSKTGFLILASVAAGNHFDPNGQRGYPPDGYHSVWAHRSSTSHEDVLVVYEEDQVRIDYIVEIQNY